jgi:FkbM family methyltransferase
MRTALFYNPRLLIERVSAGWNRRHRRRRLRGTCAHWLNEYQIESMELIEFAARRGARVFYDVGANVGTWTVLCRALVPDSRIVGFEPLPAHVEQFRKNTAGLADIRILQVALGSREESREFYPASFSDAGSFLQLGDAGKAEWNIRNEAPLLLNITPLDRLITDEGLPTPDVIKLDVQGFELEVLRGSEEALRKARWVLSEVSFKPYYKDQVLFSELAGFLGARGYQVCAWGNSMRPDAMPGQVDVLFERYDR